MAVINATELFEKAQIGIKNRLFSDAKKETDSLLRALGTKIAKECGSRTNFGPIKGEARASEKVHETVAKGGYGGDWYQLKDAVRMTIIASTVGQIRPVQAKIRATCVLGSGMRILKDAESFAHSDACGYSGANFVIQLPNQRPGEIQINVPEMIFGKEKEKDARIALEELYNQIESKFRIKGGLGHGLYEIYRAAPASLKGQRAAYVSRQYYAYLRGHCSEQIRLALKRDLDDIVKANPAKFTH